MERHHGPALGLFLLLAAATAPAQTSRDAAAGVRCDKEVRDYLETMKFIREQAGTRIGDRVAAGYVGEDALRKVQGEQGSCAAAQLIRERTARRG